MLGFSFYVVWVWERVCVCIFFSSKIPPGVCVCNHLLIDENCFWLESKVNQDQTLNFKNKSQSFIC